MSENNHITSGNRRGGKAWGRGKERREREEKGESDKMGKGKLPHKMSLQS